MDSVDHLILGHGYTAAELVPFIHSKEPQAKVVSTSRQGFPYIKFDLLDPSTWDNLPQSQVSYWTFPAVPPDLVKEFYSKKKDSLGHIVVLGSTSTFKVENSGELVDETSPLDLSIDRVQGEIYLRGEGASLVMSSGIYGVGRNPLDWVKKGWVGLSDKWINMIHVKDLSQFLYQAGRFKTGKTHIASDGDPRQWKEVIRIWEEAGLIANTPEKISTRVSKKINPAQSINELGINLKFQSFVDAVLSGVLES